MEENKNIEQTSEKEPIMEIKAEVESPKQEAPQPQKPAMQKPKSQKKGMSFGKVFLAASIFSFTSMKAKSVFTPNSNSIRITPAPSRVSLCISRNPDTCSNCLRTGATTVFSSSRADEFSPETCTVICGMAISGNKDTGNVKYVTKPTMKQAVNAISTAMGRCNRNFTIPSFSRKHSSLSFNHFHRGFVGQVHIS